MAYSQVIFVLIFCAAVFNVAFAQYSPEEQDALDKFRPLVTKFLKNDFMKSDGYLISWLREKNLNPSAAREALLTTLKWRKDNQIDEITKEDYSAFDRNYPFNVDGSDRTGRPVQIAPAGQWRPRQAVLGGQTDKYNRFMIRTMLEIPFKKIQEQFKAGQNISQYILIFDLHGINTREHLCLQCIQVYANLVMTGEEHYPRLAFKTVFINTPRIFDAVLNVVRPLMTPYSRANLNVLDHDKDKWQSQLRTWIKPEELPPRYGGTKVFKHSDYYGLSYEAINNKAHLQVFEPVSETAESEQTMESESEAAADESEADSK